MSTVATHVPVAGHRARIVNTRIEVLGLSLIAGAITFVIVSGVASGIPVSDAAFLFLPIALAATGAGLAWRFGTWAKAVGLVLGIGAGVFTFWLVFGLLQPASFVEFTAGVAFTLGVLLTLGGGVAALVRRHEVRTEATRTERIVDRSALGIVVLALVVSLPMWLSARTELGPLAAGLPEVGASNFAFTGATTIAASDRGQVQMVVRNNDAFLHTFTIDGVVNAELVPGSAQVITFAARPGQVLTYYCEPHSADKGNGPDDMAGKLTIS